MKITAVDRLGGMEQDFYVRMKRRMKAIQLRTQSPSGNLLRIFLAKGPDNRADFETGTKREGCKIRNEWTKMGNRISCLVRILLPGMWAFKAGTSEKRGRVGTSAGLENGKRRRQQTIEFATAVVLIFVSGRSRLGCRGSESEGKEVVRCCHAIATLAGG